MPVAGIYLVTNQQNAKEYVGVAFGDNGVAGRGKRHSVVSTKLLELAIKKYGHGSFMFQPIFYLRPQTVPTEADLVMLFTIERAMIAAYATVAPRGYNISEGGVAPSGEAFRQAIKDAWADPVKKAARLKKVAASGGGDKASATLRALWANPEFYDRVYAAQTIGRDRPDVVAKRIENLTSPATRKNQLAAMTPNVRTRQGETLRATYTNDPSIAERIGKSVSALHSDPVYRGIYMEGRKKAAPKIAATLTGRTLTEDHRDNVKKGMQSLWAELPRRWITNGSTNKRILLSDPLPEGWSDGRTFRDTWINDGKNNKRIYATDEVPDGWSYGRARK